MLEGSLLEAGSLAQDWEDPLAKNLGFLHPKRFGHQGTLMERGMLSLAGFEQIPSPLLVDSSQDMSNGTERVVQREIGYKPLVSLCSLFSVAFCSRNFSHVKSHYWFPLVCIRKFGTSFLALDSSVGFRS